MKITVESGDGFSFHMQARPDDLVADVKWNIQKKCEQILYRVQDQKLKYEGKVLKDDTTLKDNNIHDNCTIFLTRVVPARPSRVSSTTTSTTTVVPSSNSLPPSSTNPDSTPSPFTTVTTNLDVANLPAGSSFDLTIQSFSSDIGEGALRRIDVDHSSCEAFENTIKRALRYQATAVPAHARDSPVASQLAQLAAVQASQHTQTAGEASQPTPLAPEGIPTRQRVLAQIAAVQASQLAQAAAEASQPATPAHKYKGTPARARLLTRVAAVQASQRKQTAAQASQPARPAPKGIPTRQRVLAKITAAQASLLAQAAAEASQPATPAYKYKGTPARVRLLAHLVGVHASQRKQTSAQASQPAPPAPKVSQPNATPLNPFQAIDNRRLDRVKDNPQLRALRALVQVNPHILEPMLEELGRQNPDVRQCIQDNQAEFMQDMLQPPQRPVGNLSNQSADAIPQEMTFTLEEREAIDRLEAMGFDRKMVVQVFITCNKDEALAANSLLGNHD